MNEVITHEMWDVLIIGTGLKATIELKKHGILEARDLVGGRSMFGEICRLAIGHGGQWVGPQQKLLLAQAKDLRVETYMPLNLMRTYNNEIRTPPMYLLGRY